jgi:DNA polymerase III alpha subunit
MSCSAPACDRDELTTLADIGALNAFTNERRSALWQVEKAVRTRRRTLRRRQGPRA